MKTLSFKVSTNIISICAWISCREITDGIPVTTESGEKIGESKKAAKKAIFQVITSRIGMALPGMGELEGLKFERFCASILTGPLKILKKFVFETLILSKFVQG